MIITVGLSVVKILASELQFSADLLWAERSYFSAESGVEKALLDLKGDPVIHLIDERVFELEDLDGATTDLSINNRLDETNNQIEIPNASAIKLRLGHEINGMKEPVNIEKIELKIEGAGTTDPAGNFVLWKILCPNDNALTGRMAGMGTDSFVELKNLVGESSWLDTYGILQQSSGTVSTFWGTIPESEKTECWLSLQNISTQKIEVEILNNGILMPPPIAKVRSIGKSGEREKIVEFLYRQKNLSPYFDFGFIQQD
jgi:hypothetical protein